jgi:hypothetical protein
VKPDASWQICGSEAHDDVIGVAHDDDLASGMAGSGANFIKCMYLSGERLCRFKRPRSKFPERWLLLLYSYGDSGFCSDDADRGLQNLSLEGQWVSVTCFKLPSGESLHLFVIDEKAFDRRPIPTDFRKIGRWHVKFQEESGKVILWASRASMDEFKRYL